MADPVRNFQVVEDGEPKQSETVVKALMAIMATVSPRAETVLANVFTLLTVGSAFWVWMAIPDPNTLQLTKLGMYGAFVLAANWIVRRR